MQGSDGQTGGGDAPECYEYALQTARKDLSWRASTKAKRCVVLIGDDVPHPTTYPQNKNKICWKNELTELASMKITTYAVQCGSNSRANYFYEAIGSNSKDSKRLELSQFKSMPAIFVGICLIQVDPLGRLLANYERRLEAQGSLNQEQKKAFHHLVGAGAAAMAGAVASHLVV